MNLLDLLPAGLGQADLIASFCGFAALLVVGLVWRALALSDPSLARLQALKDYRARVHASAVRRPSRRQKIAQRQVGRLQELFQRLRLFRTREAEQATLKLMRAGFRTQEALVIYLAVRFGLPALLSSVAAIMIWGLGIVRTSEQFEFLVFSACFVIGLRLPEMILQRKIADRQKALQRALPDALDLMVICAEAGLSLDAAVNRVSREMAGTFPELSDEFGLTSIELNFLPERRKALDNLVQRTDLASIRAIVQMLAQTEKYGTPLSQSLRVLATEFRDTRLSKAEEKAARLPVLMTIPLMVFILPTIFIVLIGPAMIKLFDGLKF